MSSPITVLWLVDEPDVPPIPDARFRHAVGNPERPAATIAGLLADGAVLAVVRSEADGRQAIACGVDEVALVSEAVGEAFEKAVERTGVRAHARLHRDLFLIDLVRTDDTTALELLSAALGEELMEPLCRVKEVSAELVGQLAHAEEPARNAQLIAETVAGVARVVERMRELVRTEPTDEVVDLARVAREVTLAVASAVQPLAAFEVTITERACWVPLPHWQAAMLVASLVDNAVQSVAALGGQDRKVSVSVSVEGDSAILEIADDGVGMDGRVRTYAADPFFTTTSRGRHGLGLTLVSSRVRRAGGELLIESNEGAGTTVRALLPLSSGAPTDLPEI